MSAAQRTVDSTTPPVAMPISPGLLNFHGVREFRAELGSDDANTEFDRWLQRIGRDATPLGDEHQVVQHF